MTVRSIAPLGLTHEVFEAGIVDTEKLLLMLSTVTVSTPSHPEIVSVTMTL